MRYDEFFLKVKAGKPDSCFKEIYETAKVEYAEEGVFFLEPGFIEHVNSFYDCLAGSCGELQEAAKRVRANEELALYVLFVYRAMLNRDKFKKHLNEFVFPVGETVEYDFLPMLILLPVIPRLHEQLKERGLPEDIIKATLGQFEACMYIYEERYDKLGLNKHYFDWLQHFVDAEILNIDRLRFQMNPGLESHMVVLKNAKDDLVILPDQVEINRCGMLKGTPPDRANEDTNEDSFLATVEETAEYYEGYRVLESGRCDSRVTRYLKEQWQIALKQGDPVLEVHIPNKGSFQKEYCEKSYERAREIFAQYYPEFHYKAFYCHTWMFDTQLAKLLPPESNILQFQRKYSLFPDKTEGKDVFNFVFKLKFKTYEDMPENTRLQRAIKAHYLDGKYIYEFGGIFL